MKMIDSTKVQSLESEKRIYTHLVSALEEAVVATAASSAVNKGNSVIPTRISEKTQGDVRDYVPPNIVQDEKMNKPEFDDYYYTSGEAYEPVQGGFGASSIETSYEPPILPQPLFRSERIHREQTGLNRLFKSDDSSAPQLQMTHSKSDVSQHITESYKLTDANVINASTNSANTKPLPPEEKIIASQRSVKDVEDIIETSSSIQDKSPVANRNSMKNVAVLQNIVSSGSNLPTASQGHSEYSQDESASKTTGIHLNKVNIKNSDGQLQPLVKG
ncbi:hypothetical protein ABTG41_03000, partial [Acinetobacter baumannii]